MNHQITYYSFEDVPDVPDKQIPIDALKKAIIYLGNNTIRI